MAYYLDWADIAQEDLRDIVLFIKEENPDAARKIGYGIVERLEQAAHFLYQGRKIPEIEQETFREVLFSPYRLPYQIIEEEKKVVPIRVWHAKRGDLKLK